MSHTTRTILLAFAISIGCLAAIGLLWDTAESLRKSSTQKLTSTPTNWESERVKPYLLIRPIDPNRNVKDAYGFPIQENQWYLISKYSECYLLPVYTNSSMSDNLVEEWVSQHVAVIDTVPTDYINNINPLHGLLYLDSIEMVCFKKPYSLVPTKTFDEKMTVLLKK